MSTLQAGVVTAVLGTQWGDEGKGKLVDILAAEADLCCRFNGGSNAGHTLVVNGKKYAFHLLPCGMLYPNCDNLLGNGVVIHFATLMKEIDQLIGDFPDCLSRFKISTRAHIVFDFHRICDGLAEELKAEAKAALEAEQNPGSKSEGRGAVGAIGTTRQGIGPTYSSKAARGGVRVGDLLLALEKNDPTIFTSRYLDLLDEYKARFPTAEALHAFNYEDEIKRHLEVYGATLRNCFVDSVTYLHEALTKENKRVLAEGANAVMLDLDLGTYPFVTSSSTTAGGICTGLGIPPKFVKSTIGVVKAYTTRVGGGPFPTEAFDAAAFHMQEVGFEFGTTTGRRRRCGWLDTQLLRYAAFINGIDSINLTKLDVLTGIPTLKIATRYINKETQEAYPLYEFPSHWTQITPEQLDVEYEEHEGWTEDISGCRKFSELPAATQKYVHRLEELVGVKVSSIGVGPDREATIFCDVEEQKPAAKNSLCC